MALGRTSRHTETRSFVLAFALKRTATERQKRVSRFLRGVGRTELL